MSVDVTVRIESPEFIGSLRHLFGGAPEDTSKSSREFAATGARSADRCPEAGAPRRVDRALREDIEKMHARLQTGLSGSNLNELVPFLRNLETLSSAGQGSHSLRPRARHAIVERLRLGAGELALVSLVTLLERQNLAWPDPTRSHPKATPEEIESSRRVRIGELRASFGTCGLGRIAERLQGTVSGWAADYPARGSLLWEESVLECVAAAIWGRLLQECMELLKRKQKQLLYRAEEAVGKELAELQAMERSSASFLQTTAAIASSRCAIDEVVPEIAWMLVRPALSSPGGGFMD